MQFSTNYERHAYDAILALSDLVDQRGFAGSGSATSISDLLDSISFYGASVTINLILFKLI